jgi:hypothetical protein
MPAIKAGNRTVMVADKSHCDKACLLFVTIQTRNVYFSFLLVSGTGKMPVVYPTRCCILSETLPWQHVMPTHLDSKPSLDVLQKIQEEPWLKMAPPGQIKSQDKIDEEVDKV